MLFLDSFEAVFAQNWSFCGGAASKKTINTFLLEK